tara:strand:- start:6521 stop:6973 length:453 start_codon:yes stop_codon:yes gene_type:complete
MKKSEFKKIIKPIVAECIKESLLEGGLLSGIIVEVVKGMSTPPAALLETTPAPVKDPLAERMQRNAFNQAQSDKLKEQKSKLMSAIGSSAFNGVDLFEGTTAAPNQTSPSQQASPLHGQPPADPGVDISNLFGAVGNHWNAHMNNSKERK